MTAPHAAYLPLAGPRELAARVTEVVPARAQMGSSLGFHIILACLGIAFPAIIMVAHYRACAAATRTRCCWPAGGPG